MFARILLPSLALFLLAVSVALPGCMLGSTPGVDVRSDWTALSPPSAMPLADYERNVLYPWLDRREYAALDWVHDAGVRDTGPLIDGQYMGTHPAVRIFYSPSVLAWLERGREGELPDGSVVVKEMFPPPAVFYQEVAEHPFFQEHPEAYEDLLEELLQGWTVMIKDRGGNSHDGWFWATPGARGKQEKEAWLQANVDDDSHTRYGGFGIGTCIRCHASAESESLFSSLKNVGPPYSDEPPLRFRVDDSWRSTGFWPPYPAADPEAKPETPYTRLRAFLEQRGVPGGEALLARFDVPRQQRPFTPGELGGFTAFVDQHQLPAAPAPQAHKQPDPAFLAAFSLGAVPGADEVPEFTLPGQFADNVYPSEHPAVGENASRDYITSSNCYGCHGGLGGAPSGLSMFVQTGPNYGDGYNVSPFGEWRWSPMGLAGRDPIFHAQLESEMILLLENGGALPGSQPDPLNPLQGTVEENQKAVVNTCLSCHGAMGQRQLKIDAAAGRTLSSGSEVSSDFDPDFFYLTEALTQVELERERANNHLPSPPLPAAPRPTPAYSFEQPGDFYEHHEYGELAREGISCTVCHRIAPPGSTPEGGRRREDFLALARSHANWLPDPERTLWSDNFVYYLAENTTGQYERNEADELFGPFSDVREKPMQHAMGITPVVAPPMVSKLNADAKAAGKPETPYIADSNLCGSCHAINLPNIGETGRPFPVLDAIENNPALAGYSHSIEQATYLEWLNSEFGPGRDNVRGDRFQSCQDCHMPNDLHTRDGAVAIDRLVSQIASIQDANYPAAENALSAEDLDVPLRDDYRRHEFVGLNGFVVEMARQFPALLGVPPQDYETSAKNGAEFALDNMLLSAEQGRVATLEVGAPEIRDGRLVTNVAVQNQTGHRFPSGVSFRRAFLEFSVLDAEGKVLWASGQTNSVGLITNTEGEVLPTEFLDERRPGESLARYQPHYQEITADTQVQIYEELITNANGEFTTSFIHRVDHIKDNRLLPRGWIPSAEFAEVDPDSGVPRQGEVVYEFLRATDPDGTRVLSDPDYSIDASTDRNRDGTDELTYAIALDDFEGQAASVRVRLYSQALMPAWLHQRFAIASRAKQAGLATPATDRLYYIASRLQLADTALKDWKLPVAEVTSALKR